MQENALIAPLCLAALCCLGTPFPVAAQQSSGASGPALRVTSNLVLEDVTVTDAHGNPVHGLDASQFTVTENGKPQKLIHFEEHATLNEAELAKLPAMPPLPSGVFTNYTTVPAQGPVNVILLDSLNTPLQSQAYVRDQLRDFIRSMKPGTRLALFGMSRELHLLQGFTSNPAILQAALNTKRGTLQASALLDNKTGGDLGADSTLSELYGSGGGNDPSFAQALAQIQQFEAEQQSFQLQLRAQYTLDALNQLARFLSGLPGRKNLIWFSASFPIDILPDGDLADPFAAMADSEDEFRETVTLMARSHVAVFPVDARGLMVNPNLNAENSGAKYAADSSRFSKDTSSFFDQTAAEHSTMIQMADKTGGKAFINTNGLKEAVEEAIDFGSNYYTLGYYPSGHKWDSSFHPISIKVNDPKLKLSYRIGYYADDPDAPPFRSAKLIFDVASAKQAAAPASDTAHAKAMRAAMQFGAPEPTQIIMKVKVAPVSAGHEQQVADGNVPDPKTHGPYHRYSVDYAADARNVAFVRQADGSLKATCEFAVLVYDNEGVLINSLSHTAIADVDEQKHQTMIKSGMHMHQEISVPDKGHYWLRVGIHDRLGDAMGAVEVNLDNIPRSTLPTSSPAK